MFYHFPLHIHESVLNLIHLNGLILAASSCKFTVCTFPYYKCVATEIWKLEKILSFIVVLTVKCFLKQVNPFTVAV